MEDDFNFEAYAVNVDSDCVENDFDCYDLYGDRVEENDNHDFDDIDLDGK